MKNRVFLLAIFIFSLGRGQDKFSADYVATYFVTYQLKKEETKEQMILLMNTEKKESYYQCVNGYVLDSLIRKGDMASDDIAGLMNYRSNFNEKVYNKNNALTVFEKILNIKTVYNETPNIKWTITKDKKEYLGKTLTKAYANAFGRKWHAWFSDEPLYFAPYKFVGLPGLVYLVEAEDKSFLIELTQLVKKKTKEKVFVPSLKGFLKLEKSEIEKVRYGQKVVRASNLVITKDPQEKKNAEYFLKKVLNNTHA